VTVTVIEEGENFTDSLSAVILHAVNVIEISNDAEHSTGLVIAEPLSFLFLAIKVVTVMVATASSPPPHRPL